MPSISLDTPIVSSVSWISVKTICIPYQSTVRGVDRPFGVCEATISVALL
jgi:hypothetical protein